MNAPKICPVCGDEFRGNGQYCYPCTKEQEIEAQLEWEYECLYAPYGKQPLHPSLKK